MQQEYDKETKHSIDTVKQKEWNERIAMEIGKIKTTVARN